MKKIVSIKMLFVLSVVWLTAMVCVSCSDDDGLDNEEVDSPPFTGIEKDIVGGWPELGDNGVTFFQNGILIHNGEVGHWQYDEVSKTLTTDIVNGRKQVLIWQINMLQDGSMVGIQVWNGSTFAAKKNTALAVKDILYSGDKTWTRDKKSKFLVIYFQGLFYDNKIREITYYYKNKSSDNRKWVGYNDISVSEQDLTSITITSGEYGKHIIHNPYSYDKVWFEFPDGRKYYPVTTGMSNLEKVNMSEDESKLVGKWICQEQIWDGEKPGQLYFEDKYGMEFYDDYWGKMWSGGDQLMEVMGGREFAWWIKENKLYRDNDHYSILKLTDNEMELEWRDGGNIIACKFYKYDANKGLLIDQLEYVDLGLSVKWATRNLGAEDRNASQLGNYYSWGETSPKEEYVPNNYKYCEKGWCDFTKYCSDSHYGYNGFVDYKTTLDSEDDAATTVRGNEWRMPTTEEYQELIDNCTWEGGKDSYGNAGYKVTGKTGYYIFFPAAGFKIKDTVSDEGGYYLTNSTSDEVLEGIPCITNMAFYRNSKPIIGLMPRTYGCSIRPVRK